MSEPQAHIKDEQDLFIAQASKDVKRHAFYLGKAIVSAPAIRSRAIAALGRQTFGPFCGPVPRTLGADFEGRITVRLPPAQDEDHMEEALKQAAALLGELRTSLLGPQQYYQLYMQANDELRSLEVRCGCRGKQATPLQARLFACKGGRITQRS